MQSFWIIIEQGYEYNDSTYDMGGEALVKGNAYTSKEDAEGVAKERLKEILKSFRLCDFDEGTGFFSMVGRSVIVDEYMAEKDIDSKEHYGRMYYGSIWDLRWEDFIAWCEERSYPWIMFAPDLITVQEVKYHNE